MKNPLGSILITLLLWLLHGASVNEVFAFSGYSPSLDSRNHRHLQTDQNSQAAIFSEIVFSKNFASEENFSLSGFSIPQFSASDFKLANVTKSLNFSSLDRRKLIFHLIYPFHFFW